MSNEAILFLENTDIRQEYLYHVARRARKMGWTPLLIRGSKTRTPPPGLFQKIVTTKSWDLPVLKNLFDSFSKEYNIAALLEVARLFSHDGLVAAQIARLAEEKNLRHHSADSLYRANNKYLLRETLWNADVRTVDFGMASDLSEAFVHARRIGFPLILKPLTGAASNLVFRCQNNEELAQYFPAAIRRLPHVHYKELYSFPHSFPTAKGKEKFFDPAKALLLEKYIPGRELSVECIATEEEVFPFLVHEKLTLREKAGVVYEDLLILPPVSFNPEQIEQIKKYAIQSVEAIGLKNTFAHLELRWEEKTGPQILEINPRIGGGQVTKSFQTFLNLDPFQVELELLLGTFEPTKYNLQTEMPHAMCFFFPPHGGVLESLKGLEDIQKLPGMIAVEQSHEIGEVIYGDEEECFLIQCWMKGKSIEAIRDTYQKALGQIKIGVAKNKGRG